MGLTVSEYLEIQHRGDPSRVKFVHIDYSTVRTVPLLCQWAYDTFKMPPGTKRFARKGDAGKMLKALWDAITAEGRHYIILENYPGHMSDAVKNVLKEWQQVLGFHLSRDNAIEVAFLQNPDTKGKRP